MAHPGGRPEVYIDWEAVKNMAQIHCTQEEMAFICGVSVDTLERRAQKKFGCSFADFCDKKKSFGKMSLRRAMWARALEGDNTMMIWLSKNHLNMTDKSEQTNIAPPPELKFGWGDEANEDNTAATDSTSKEDSGVEGKIQDSSVGTPIR